MKLSMQLHIAYNEGGTSISKMNFIIIYLVCEMEEFCIFYFNIQVIEAYLIPKIDTISCNVSK